MKHTSNIISYIANSRKFTGAYIIETENFLYEIPDGEKNLSFVAIKGDIIVDLLNISSL